MATLRNRIAAFADARVAKALLAFLLALLPALLPRSYFDPRIYGRSFHVAPIAQLLLPPPKHIDAHLTSTIMALVGMIVGVGFTAVTIVVCSHLGAVDDLYSWLQLVWMLGMLWAFSFGVAYWRAKSSRPAVYAGTALAQWMVTTILSAHHPAESASPDVWAIRIWHLTLPILYGIIINLVIHAALFPSFSVQSLREGMNGVLDNIDALLDAIQMPDYADTVPALMEQHHKTMSHLSHAVMDAVPQWPFSRLHRWQRWIAVERDMNRFSRLIVAVIGSRMERGDDVKRGNMRWLSHLMSKATHFPTMEDFAMHAATWKAGTDILRQALILNPGAQSEVRQELLETWHRKMTLLAYQTTPEANELELLLVARELDQCLHNAIGDYTSVSIDTESVASPTQEQLYQHTQTDPVYHPLLAAASAPSHMPSAPLLPMRLHLWYYLTSLAHSFPLRFALKSSLTVLLLALQGFPSPTLSWSILSAFVIVSPTVAGSNRAGLFRLLGTALGIGYALAVEALQGPPWAVIGLAVPAWIIIIKSSYPKVGQVSLIAACLILLGPWEGDVLKIGWQRGESVLIGVFAGLIVSWYVWPFEARVQLRKGLAEWFLQVATVYYAPGELDRYTSVIKRQQSSCRLIPTNEWSPMWVDWMVRLHQHLQQLDQLLFLTAAEPRLKGPFPREGYRSLLRTCQRIEQALLVHCLHSDEARPEGILSLYVTASVLLLKQPVVKLQRQSYPDPLTAEMVKVESILVELFGQMFGSMQVALEPTATPTEAIPIEDEAGSLIRRSAAKRPMSFEHPHARWKRENEDTAARWRASGVWNL